MWILGESELDQAPAAASAKSQKKARNESQTSACLVSPLAGNEDMEKWKVPFRA